MFRSYIYLAVVVAGASVLAIEILGTRIIAPFYGASLYLWSALISVTLAALAVGYALGGRWADRGPKRNRFCVLIGAAGTWIALIPWLRIPVLALAEHLGLRTAVLVTATALFFVPLALLGMVSPYAIRLLAASLDVVGRTAGNLYAVSTIASVAAALATGFLLIPYVGVYRLLSLIGILLIATAVIGLWGERRRRASLTIMMVLVVAAIFGAAVAPAQTAQPEKGLLAVRESPYGELRVVDREDVRYLLIDGGTHSIVDRQSGLSLFPYVNVLDIPKGFFAQPGRMLLLGLGGGSVVKSWDRDGWQVDAVEIDPAVVELAHTYFGLGAQDARIFEMDARQYLLSHDQPYDVVIMDAFGSSAIPFHLVTREVFGLTKSRLAPGGLLALNVEAVGWHSAIVNSLAATLKDQFAHVVVLPIAEPPDQLGNLVLLAADRPLQLAEEPPVPQGRFTAEYDRAHAWDNRFEVDTTGISVLTDDLNPIDVWSEQVNLVARRGLHEYFGREGLDR